MMHLNIISIIDKSPLLKDVINMVLGAIKIKAELNPQMGAIGHEALKDLPEICKC